MEIMGLSATPNTADIATFVGTLLTCFDGAPGQIRTPDLVVRSHELENASQITIYETKATDPTYNLKANIS